MAVGFIKRALIDKGYGFVSVKGGDDCYFRQADWSGEWHESIEGMRVECDIARQPDGRNRAVNVRPAT